MIIVGGTDVKTKRRLSSGAIFDSRTQQWKDLLNNMPVALSSCCAVANAEYAYVIGGEGQPTNYNPVNVLYRLSLKTLKWTTMAPMRRARLYFAAVLRENYIYVFGGYDGEHWVVSAERYSIVDNSWEELPNMPRQRRGHSACLLGKDIFLVGGYDYVSDVFDTVSLRWETGENPRNVPVMTGYVAAAGLKGRYLVMIVGRDPQPSSLRSCFIYDSIFNCWSETPASMKMVEGRSLPTPSKIFVMDGNIVVFCGGLQGFDSIEFINVDALLEYAPLIYQFPPFYFNQILVLGKDNICNDNSAKRKRCDDD